MMFLHVDPMVVYTHSLRYHPPNVLAFFFFFKCTASPASLELWVRALKQCITYKRAILDENLDAKISGLRKKEDGVTGLRYK
jgi:hypothetical protein